MIATVGPGAFAAGAALFGQEPHPTVVESPLPGGIAAVVRFFFTQVPQWIQIGGAILGAVVAGYVALYLWRRRAAIVGWIRTRPRQVRIALAAGVIALALGAAGFGGVTWNYMQHDNGFCTGCHVMSTAYVRFTQSEHDSLSCHDCHQQSIFASARQMYLWVADRPEEIGKHAKVPNTVCAQCHVTGQKEVWQRIASTAGHRTHLESDSSALAGVQCVTCHGLEVHRFAPVDSTCGQANCHINNAIQLGKMQQQTSLHCVTCHQFTAEVPKLATRDSASGTLRPGEKQCFSCHEMQALLASFDPARDPHSGTCGMCHNPHTQATPRAAAATCTTAGCHDAWRQEPFHSGVRHRNVGQQCTLCHQPHQAKVDASDCAGCHAEVNRRSGGRLRLPQAFDTTGALRRTSWSAPHESDRVKGKGDAPPPPFDDPPWTMSAAAPADTFPHDRHNELACLTCHASSTGHGRLTFAPPRGCQICHHQAPATSTCASCHRPESTAAAQPATLRVTVEGHPTRERAVAFRHETHKDVRCAQCHTTPVSLVPDSATGSCAACHDEHHEAERDCAACHTGDATALSRDVAEARRVAHAPPAEGHTSCDACHTPATVERLVPDRAFCVTCHAPQQADHYPARECTVCHFQASPDAFRTHLRRVGAGSGGP